MVSEKEKFAAMMAQLEDTGYNWTEHWRVNSKGVCMTAKMREDRETITTTSTPLNTMDELAYKELETENKNLKNSLGEANDKLTVLQLRSKSSLKDWKVTLSYDIKHEDTYLIKGVTKEDAIYIAENQNASPRYDCVCIKNDESDIEDSDTTIKEVVWNSEKKDWIDKEKK